MEDKFTPTFIYNSPKENVYKDLINSYISDLKFSPVDNINNFTVYGAKTNIPGKYVLVFVPENRVVKRNANIQELDWKSVQVRKLSKPYNLSSQSWIIGRGLKDLTFEMQERSMMHTRYRSTDEECPYELLMMHDIKKKSMYQFYKYQTLSDAMTKDMVISYDPIE